MRDVPELRLRRGVQIARHGRAADAGGEPHGDVARARAALEGPRTGQIGGRDARALRGAELRRRCAVATPLRTVARGAAQVLVERRAARAAVGVVGRLGPRSIGEPTALGVFAKLRTTATSCAISSGDSRSAKYGMLVPGMPPAIRAPGRRRSARRPRPRVVELEAAGGEVARRRAVEGERRGRRAFAVALLAVTARAPTAVECQVLGRRCGQRARREDEDDERDHARRKSSTRRFTSAGCSWCTKCPAFGTISTRRPAGK